jgi:hypothetical protein
LKPPALPKAPIFRYFRGSEYDFVIYFAPNHPISGCLWIVPGTHK